MKKIYTSFVSVMLLAASFAAQPLAADVSGVFPVDYKRISSSRTDKCHLKGLFFEGVAEIRIALLPYEKDAEFTAQDTGVAEYLTGEGWESRAVSLTPGNTETDIPFDGSVRYKLLAMGLDSEGNSITDPDYAWTYLYSNYRGTRKWHSLGKGSLTEKISYVLADKSGLDSWSEAPLWTYDVEVEAADDNPALFRIRNPFGSSHPDYANLPHMEKSNLIYEFPEMEGEDYYIELDCTDPSRVRVDYTLCGLYYGMHPAMIFSGPRNLQGWNKYSDTDVDREYPWEWGKYRCDAVKFGSGSIYVEHSAADNLNPSRDDFTLRLPSWGNYEFTMERVSEDAADGIRFTRLGEKVKSLDIALVPLLERIDNRFFEERIVQKLIDRDPSLHILSVDAAEDLLVKTGDLKTDAPGAYTVVALSRDDKGNPGRGHLMGSLVRRVPFSETRWTYLGKAHLSENVVASLPYFSEETYEQDVDIYSCPGLPSYYALVNPYAKLADSSPDIVADSQYLLYVNASDPGRVYIDYRNMGSFGVGQYTIDTGLHISADNSPLQFYSMYHYMYTLCWNRRISPLLNGCADFAGKLEGGTISFGNGDFANDMSGDGSEMNTDFFMNIKLPAAGIDGIGADSDDAPAYYDMQGIRVENPGKGIYLRRQGGRTSKIVVR